MTLVSLRFAMPLVEQIDHALLDVGRVDAAHRADFLRQLLGHVARAGADVGDRRALLQLEHVDRAIGILFLIAFGTVEPVRALDAHRLGVAAAAERVDAGLCAATAAAIASAKATPSDAAKVSWQTCA